MRAMGRLRKTGECGLPGRRLLILICLVAVSLWASQACVEIKVAGLGKLGAVDTEEPASTESPQTYTSDSRSAGVDTRRKNALVIGNAKYSNAPLRNTVNDAKDMKNALERLGFTVIYLENAAQRQMEDGIRQFGSALKRGGVGLFFFSGHGMQVDGRNYLLPIGSRISTESDIKYEAVDAGRILDQMTEAENGLNIVILDACRNNPFERSFRAATRGLARMDASTGSFVAFATAPGSVASDGRGRNGVFTMHLLRHMRTPGLKIEDVLKKVRNGVIADTGNKQVPWQSSSLTGDFYFVQPVPVAATQPTVPTAPVPGSARPGTSLPTMPSAPKVSFDDLARESESKKQWSAWQTSMDQAWDQAGTMERDAALSPSQKVEVWRRVMTAYQDNNPFAGKDDTMRRLATERMTHWQREDLAEQKKRLEEERRLSEEYAALQAEKKRLEEQRRKQQQVAALPQTTRSNLVLRDYFSDNRNNWPVRNNKDMQATVGSGRYRLRHNAKAGYMLLKQIGLTDRDNFTIEVEFRHISGVTDWGFGLAFGAKNSHNGYVVYINDDGYFSFGKFDNNKWRDTIPWRKLNVIRKKQSNVLKLLKKGNTLEFYVNGNIIDRTTAPQFFGDRIGFQVDNVQTVEVRRIIVERM